MPQPFVDLKIVELSQYISGPYCGMLLAGLGAEVLKIEEPEAGDISRRCGPYPQDDPHLDHSGLYHYLNRNKQGVTLNINNNTGREIFLELIKKADVLIDDLPPAQAEKLHLDYPSLQAVNKNLIVASITPFGQNGPYRDYKAYAINASAIGGMSSIVGEPRREPLTPPFALGHFQTGIIAANAIIFALMARKKNVAGQHIDISEAESWSIFHTGNVVSAFIFGGRKRVRTGHRTFGPYPYTLLPCKDGYISMIALRGSEWKRFLEIVGDGQIPEWYSTDERFKDRSKAGTQYADVLDSLLSPWLMSHTRDEIFQSCREKHVPFTPVRNIDEVVNCTHLDQRAYFNKITCGVDGRYKCPGPPVRFTQTTWSFHRSAPALSEHNFRIFTNELGYAPEQVVQLRKMRVI